MNDAALHAPATLRNREPILTVLQRVLPETGLVLELNSGSGEHAVHFAAALPQLQWQPSDIDPAARASIAARSAAADLPNLLPVCEIDATAPAWPVTHAAAVVSINMIHIAPWKACLGLLEGAARTLPPGDGILYLYGPFKRHDSHTAPSNAQFDRSLRNQNAQWGIRNLETVVAEGAARGFEAQDIVEMPANNLSVVFRKTN